MWLWISSCDPQAYSAWGIDVGRAGLAGSRSLLYERKEKEKKTEHGEALHLGPLVKYCVITRHTNPQFICEKEKKMKPGMRENGWHTWINAFIDPIGFSINGPT